MNKKFYLLALLLLPCMVFAQSKLPFTSSKPFNEGNFKIDLSYAKMMKNQLSIGYPELRIGLGYGVTNWCVVGVFGSYGTQNERFSISGGYDTISNTTIAHFEGDLTTCYYRYGINAELHPLALLLPDFYFVDVYCRGELGIRTVSYHFEPEYSYPYIKPVQSNFLYGGDIGVAINPLRYFGLFYELCYDNFNYQLANLQTGEKKPKAFHRFGLNVRFPGPKKWQKQQ